MMESEPIHPAIRDRVRAILKERGFPQYQDDYKKALTMSKTKLGLRLDSIPLPAPTSGKLDVGESWMYEDNRGLDVIIEVPGVGTISQKIPWKAVTGCVDRYRSTQAPKRRKAAT